MSLLDRIRRLAYRPLLLIGGAVVLYLYGPHLGYIPASLIYAEEVHLVYNDTWTVAREIEVQGLIPDGDGRRSAFISWLVPGEASIILAYPDGGIHPIVFSAAGVEYVGEVNTALNTEFGLSSASPRAK